MDAKTFGAEVRKIEKLLYRVAWTYLGNGPDVEDAVQDALIRAWEKRETLRNPEQFKPWLTRILTNQCKDVLRKRRRWSFFPLGEADAVFEMPEPENAVLEAMKRLRPEQRLAATLHYVDGYAVSEIASLLDVPEGTVKTRLRSARRRLSQMLRVEWEDA